MVFIRQKVMTMKKIRIKNIAFQYAITLLLLLILSCNLLESPAPKPIFTKNFVQGIWVPSIFTFDFLKESGYGFSEMSLEFKGDGTVSAVNIPADWIFQENYSNKDYFSGEGAWEVTEPTISDLSNLDMGVNIKDEMRRDMTVQFGEILDDLYFNLTKPTEHRTSVTFEKCHPHLHIMDEKFLSFVQALKEAHHEELGFTPIDPKAIVEIDGTIGKTDIGLHVDSYTSRYITFKLEGDKYIWTSEQEIYTGPHISVASDGAVDQDNIVFQYQTLPINGDAVNILTIQYHGNDPRIISNPTNLFATQYIQNKEDILPILEEWKTLRSNQPPFPQYLCP
jgi:hypothetical protein